MLNLDLTVMFMDVDFSSESLLFVVLNLCVCLNLSSIQRHTNNVLLVINRDST